MKTVTSFDTGRHNIHLELTIHHAPLKKGDGFMIKNSEIVNLAEQVRELALSNDQADIADDVQNKVIDYLTKSEINIPFLGEFSVGKSSILNRLLEENILPLNVKPTTSVITEIRYGDHKTFFLGNADGARQNMSEDEFRNRASGVIPSPPDCKLEVLLPQPFLDNNLCLVDTPGVHSMNDQHQEITYGFLPKSDAAFIVMDANQGDIPGTVKEFLENQILAQSMEKLIFVVNRIDDIPEDDRSSHVRQFKKTLSDIVPNPVVIPCTADPEASLLESPGVDHIRDQIVNHLIPSKRKILQNKGMKTLSVISGAFLRMLEIKKNGISSSANEVDEEIEKLKSTRMKIAMEMRQLKDMVENRCDAIKARTKMRVQAVLRRVAGHAEQEIRNLKDMSKDRMQVDLQQKIQGRIAKEVEMLIQSEIKPEIESLANEVKVRIESIPSKVPELFVSNISLPGGAVMDFLVEAAIITIINVILPGEWIIAILARLLGGKYLNSLTKPIKTFLQTIVGKIFGEVAVKKMTDAVRNVVMSLESDLTSHINEQLDNIGRNLSEEVENNFKNLIDQQEHALKLAKDKFKLSRERRNEEIRNLESQIGTLKHVIESVS